MENALLIGLSRQSAMMREMSTIANNLANMNTTAYKSQSMLFDEFLMPTASESSPDKTLSFVQDYGQFRNMSDGEMQTTGNPLDVAIAGEGMFKVNTPQGPQYTRNGHLQLDNSGQLVTSNGYPVTTTAGTTLTFANDEKQITIASDGTVTTDKGQRGKIALVSFANMQELKSTGDNLYTTTQTENPVTAPRMIQGSIEGSNVKSIVEMTNMMDVMRSYESASKLVDAADNMRRQAISQIGNPT
ncbi:MAG: flagellar basal-body rod protein FlgF [Parvibaculum sp.]|uniref:flagellar basal-body rod protein FlgF n=1 Tax=Parvibaculum sp. TaxID=2024848 RepID=UPI0025FA4A3E|nr:flagellar basal-body rod protein FlgF [Parvibaculum sp.]MCE9650690.1 flagellar basal-body rod protein FlgF [Parvibaculum sp.]